MENNFEWKNYHSAVLFSMLNPSNEMSSLDVLRKFLQFVGMTESEIDKMFPSFTDVEFSTNEKQNVLLIQNNDNSILIENGLDEISENDDELMRCYEQATQNGVRIARLIRLAWKKNRDGDIPPNLQEKIKIISAMELAEFCKQWCAEQTRESLAKGILWQYARNLKTDFIFVLAQSQ